MAFVSRVSLPTFVRFFAAPAKTAAATPAATPALKTVDKKLLGNVAKNVVVKPGNTNMEFLNIYKGSKPPAVLPDDQYPEWMWTLHHKDVTLTELLERDFTELSDQEKKRLVKLQRRQQVKGQNYKSKMN